MRPSARAAPRRPDPKRTARDLLAALRLWARRASGAERALIADYLRAHPVRKLHLGCGPHVIPGWLNADHRPLDGRVLRLDARREFPFDDGTFDYVYSEHMISYLTFAEGSWMLGECRRVLKPRGRLRIAAPTLQFLVDLYRPQKSELQERYIRWSIDTFVPTAPRPEDTFVINNFMSGLGGHRFIYDEKVLRGSLEAAGFVDITGHELQESGAEPLRGLEHEGRMPSGLLRLETMVLEGAKP
jgi:predicted SAM-dependent methyltransferase